MNVLMIGIGVLAAIGITVSGLQYLTARDNTTNTAKSKMRLAQIVAGLVVYVLIFAGVNFLIPGYEGFDAAEDVANIENAPTKPADPNYGSGSGGNKYGNGSHMGNGTPDNTPFEPGEYDGGRGTAGSLNGTLIVVTIFANDSCVGRNAGGVWTDALKTKSFNEMSTAMSWLSKTATEKNIFKNSSKYADLVKDTLIYWNYSEYPELTTNMSFNFCFADNADKYTAYLLSGKTAASYNAWAALYIGIMDDVMTKLSAAYPPTTPDSPGAGYVISTQELREKFPYEDGKPADNVAFLIIPPGYGRSFAVDKGVDELWDISPKISGYYPEWAVVFAAGQGGSDVGSQATVYAHELTHLFGAVDLYQENAGQNSTSGGECPNDLMNVTDISDSTTTITRCTDHYVY